MKAVGKNKKVFVGLSGGVDSSVSAALLVRAGYDVTGVFIKVWQPEWVECTWKEDRLDAMRVAAKLKIPFVTLDLEKEYKKGVADYMIAEYAAGRTPNPDVFCNKEVKFGAFYDWAMGKGADFIATGHYAKVLKNKEGESELHKADDVAKEQSFFLAQIRKDILPKVLFPIGELEKLEVRKLAKKFRLPVSEKKDSQGLCFIGKLDFKDFLSHFIMQEAGNVLDIGGNVIGSHDGALLLTIGERHGFKITAKSEKTPIMYVVSKDIAKNTVTVSENPLDAAPKGKKIELHSWNSLAPIPKDFTVVVRYHGKPVSASLTSLKSDKLVLETREPLFVAPGQTVVLYDGTLCLGSGIAA